MKRETNHFVAKTDADVVADKDDDCEALKLAMFS